MMDVWTSRTPREQVLLLVMAVLVLCVGLSQFLVQPVLEQRRDSRAALARSQALLAAVNEATLQQRANPAPRADEGGAAGQPVRSVVTATARAMNVAITRVQPQGDDSVVLWIDAVETEALFRWISLMDTRHHLSVDQIQINSADRKGLVTARIVVAGGQR